MKKCPQVEILELKDKVSELQAENDRLRATIDELSREFEILDSACDFWKQEAIDRGYEE